MPAQKFCPICLRLGLRSRIYVPSMVSRTAMLGSTAYYDEDGIFVPAVDPNITTSQWSCSRGHKWTEKEQYGKVEIIERPGGELNDSTEHS